MIVKELQNNNSDHLVIFFAGWSSHFDTFKDFTINDCDIWIVYDYRDLEISLPDSSKYKQISIIAWSFGVWVASYLRNKIGTTATTVAIAGSMKPIDDKYGINSKAFTLTVQSIEKSGISKFNRRMCGKNSDLYTPTPRPIEELTAELKALEQFSKHEKVEYTKWDYAILCTEDLIFPVANLESFWKDYTIFAPIKTEEPHFMFSSEGIKLLNKLINRE